MNIRLERPEDHAAVERLTLAAFKTFTFPDGSKPERPNEHYLVHILRDAAVFVPELDFVGELVGETDGELVGEIDGELGNETYSEIVANIMFTKSRVVRPDGNVLDTLTFGPVSVTPRLHGRGLGAQIIRHGLDRARAMGFGAVIIMGHPQYYPRFGFKPAADFNLTLPDGSAIEPFMALELVDGYLGSCGGTWHEDEVFEIDQSAFEAWDAGNQLERGGAA